MKNKQKFERKWKKVHFMPSARTEQGFFCFVSFSPPAHERNEVGRIFRPSDFIG